MLKQHALVSYTPLGRGHIETTEAKDHCGVSKYQVRWSGKESSGSWVVVSEHRSLNAALKQMRRLVVASRSVNLQVVNNSQVESLHRID
jgi:hypothetical protein